MFGRSVFEVTEVKEGRMVKKRDFEAENSLKKLQFFQRLMGDDT